jgi:hypothetical protein
MCSWHLAAEIETAFKYILVQPIVTRVQEYVGTGISVSILNVLEHRNFVKKEYVCTVDKWINYLTYFLITGSNKLKFSKYESWNQVLLSEVETAKCSWFVHRLVTWSYSLLLFRKIRVYKLPKNVFEHVYLSWKICSLWMFQNYKLISFLFRERTMRNVINVKIRQRKPITGHSHAL